MNESHGINRKNELLMKMNIRTKLIGGFVIVIAMMVGVFAIGWNGLNSLDAAADHIVHEQLPEDIAIRDLELQLALQGELYMEYALTGEEELLHDAREKTTVILEEAAHLEEQLAGEPELLAALKQVESKYEELNHEKEEFVSLYISGAHEEAIEHLHLVTAEEAQMEEELAAMAHDIELALEASFEAAGATHDRAVMMMIVVALLAAVVGMTVAFFLSRSISVGVGKIRDGATDLSERVLPAVVDMVDAISSGDLTKKLDLQLGHVEVNSKDEIHDTAEAFNTALQQVGETTSGLNRMVDSLVSLIGQVGESAESMSETSSQLAGASEQTGQAVQGSAVTSQQVAQGAEEQSTRSQEMTVGMDQLTQAIEQVSQGSQEQAGSIAQSTALVNQVSNAIEDVARTAQSATESSREAHEAAISGKPR
jgi:methyl-accepting chemotaxis protein